MKITKETINKQTLLLGAFFVLFVLSYTVNIFRITESDLFHGFERQPEGLVIGRLARSAQDGVFSYGGLTGINYDSQTKRSTEQYAMDLAAQHNLYITENDVPDSYQAYKSQSGGQGIVLSMMHKILPIDNAKKMMVYRGLNALLVALVFVLFGGWVMRNYGFIAGLVTLLLILFSSWLNMYAHNLWWVLWNFYLPFLTILLVLEKRHRSPSEVSNLKVFGLLFAAVFLKCFFTGFEFITTTLAAAICPIVYYFYIEKKPFIQFVIFSIKASVCMVAAVLVQMVMLVAQIKLLDGTFAHGINHIVQSFTKRTEALDVSHWEVLKMYLGNDVFNLGFLPNTIEFYFGSFILLLMAVGLYVYLKGKGNRKNKALIVTSVFAILAPLSWFVVFKQHSFEHPHMDYIVWYLPFMLYGFCLIGVAVESVVGKRESKCLANDSKC